MAPRPLQETDVPLIDPNVKNLVAEVSLATPTLYTSHKPARLNSAGKRTRILAIDCGIKANIIRYFMTCGVELLVSRRHHRGPSTTIHHRSLSRTCPIPVRAPDSSLRGLCLAVVHSRSSRGIMTYQWKRMMAFSSRMGLAIPQSECSGFSHLRKVTSITIHHHAIHRTLCGAHPLSPDSKAYLTDPRALPIAGCLCAIAPTSTKVSADNHAVAERLAEGHPHLRHLPRQPSAAIAGLPVSQTAGRAIPLLA